MTVVTGSRDFPILISDDEDDIERQSHFDGLDGRMRRRVRVFEGVMEELLHAEEAIQRSMEDDVVEGPSARIAEDDPAFRLLRRMDNVPDIDVEQRPVDPRPGGSTLL